MNKMKQLSSMNRMWIFCAAAVLLLSSCGSSITARKINIPPNYGENFTTTPTLKRFMSDVENQEASVVVRDFSVAGSVSGVTGSSTISSLVERGLMTNHKNPRDRSLFESAVEKMQNNNYKDVGQYYRELRKTTGTDLIFEIYAYPVPHYVSEFYDQNGRTHDFEIDVSKNYTVSRGYYLYGFSIEIKVIFLEDNRVAGIYQYEYVPCTQGCNVVDYSFNELRYKMPETGQQFRARTMVKGETWEDFLDMDVVSDFISKKVIPNIYRDMARETPKF